MRKTRAGDEAEDSFPVSQEPSTTEHPERFFAVKVKKVNILEDLMQSAFWKTQKLEKMNLIGTEDIEPNF